MALSERYLTLRKAISYQSLLKEVIVVTKTVVKRPSKVLNLNIDFYLARKWFIFWLIEQNRTDGILESEIIPFLLQASEQLGWLLRWPPEPHPLTQIKMFVESKYLIKEEKPDSGISYKVSSAGKEEFLRLNQLINFEELLGLGEWSKLALNLKES